MRVAYTIVIVSLSLLGVYLCPDSIKTETMFSLLVMMLSINRWENDKIMKEIKESINNSYPAGFIEWIGYNYVRLHQVWVHKYNSH